MKDHETHNACNQRLTREGGSATCCYCDPHDDCLLRQSSDRVTDASKTITKRTLELITALLDCVCNQIRPDDKKWIEYSGAKVAEIYELIKTIDEKPNKKTNI